MNYFKTHKLHVSFIIILLSLLSGWLTQVLSQGTIIDHTCTDITKIPESAINQAKAMLHIGYGHTSHGSQITTGMTGLITFANNGGLGLSHPQDIFEWNNGGINGALDLEEGDGYGSDWLDHDCGYYPEWVNETKWYGIFQGSVKSEKVRISLYDNHLNLRETGLISEYSENISKGYYIEFHDRGKNYNVK